MAGRSEQSSEKRGGEKRALPDVALLNQGAREPFNIAPVARLGLTSTPYDGVLQGIKDYFGYPLKKAPALVILDDKNIAPFSALTHDEFSYPIPSKDNPGIGYDYEDVNQLFIASPESATREHVAEALVRAYIYDHNSLLITEPDQLWEPTRTKLRRTNLPFTSDEIPPILCGEAFVAGLATWIAATTMLPERDKDNRLAGIISGQQEEEINIPRAREYISENSQDMYKMQELLQRAEALVGIDENPKEYLELYAEAQALKIKATEPIGLFFVQGVMNKISVMERSIHDDTDRETQEARWIKLIIEKPPTQLPELVSPSVFFTNQFDQPHDDSTHHYKPILVRSRAAPRDLDSWIDEDDPKERIYSKDTPINDFRKKGFQMLDVPVVPQKMNNWCGYAQLSSLLNYQGIELSTQQLFEHHYGPIHLITDDISRLPGPDGNNLAATAYDIVGKTMRVDRWDEDKLTTYNEVRRQKGKKDATPFSLLRMYLEDLQVPVMIRSPWHWLMAIGIRPETHEYVFNNSLSEGKRMIMAPDRFEEYWGSRETLNPSNTSFQMIAIRSKGNR